MEAKRLLSYPDRISMTKGPTMQVSDIRNGPSEQWRPGVETRMLASASNGAAQLCIFEQWIAPGTGAPTHWHPVEEVLTVRDGEAEMWIGEQRAILAAGQSLIIPAGRKHGFRNSGDRTLHLHAVLASPIFEATAEGATEVVRRWVAVAFEEPQCPTADSKLSSEPDS